jgi:class 3 adenylate cyclase/tetratricopeptide (TPR) repeat protein
MEHSVVAGSASASRRLVTVLFADVVGSTSIGEQLDPERFAAIQGRMFAAVRPVIEQHGGTVEKFIGDAVMAVFGYPVVREDDALRAARAALELSPSIATLDADLHRRAGIRLRLRVGLHSGEVLASGGTDVLVSGDVVNLAARIQSLAEPGAILASAETMALLGPAIVATELGPVQVKGRDRAVVVHELTGLTGAETRAGLDARFVGRSEEMNLLDAARAESLAGRTRLVTLLGQAGVGKSRLVREFIGGLAPDVQVLRGRCLSYGDGITWWALGGILRDAAGLPSDAAGQDAAAGLDRLFCGRADGDEMVAILGSVLGVGTRVASADDIAWAARRLLAHLAASHPLVVVVEDIHWAEPPLLDLLETLVEWSPDLRLLLVCPARPELLQARPGWASEGESMRLIRLDMLDDADAQVLLRSLPGGEAIPSQLAERILAAAEGNPLYLEEFIARLRDLDELSEADGTWRLRSEESGLEVPPTVTALVSARIDGLPPRERLVAERGSVVGRLFERSAVGALATDLASGSVGPALLALTRRAIVMPDRSNGSDEDVVRFRHILLRDAAYARIPRSDRADLHRRLAAWLEGTMHDQGDELVPVIAHHLATSVELLLSLDPLAEGVDRLMGETDRWMRRAIQRARRLQAWTEMANLADRLRVLADSAGTLDEPSWLELTLTAAHGDHVRGSAQSAVDRLTVALADSRADDPRRRARLLERLAAVRRSLGDETGAFGALEEALMVLPSENRDEVGLVLAARGRFRLILRDDSEGAIADCERAIELAGDAETEPWYASALVTLGTALGDRPDDTEWEWLFDRALALAEHNGDSETVLRAYGNRSVVLGRRGDVEQALLWTERGIRRADEMGAARSPTALTLRHNVVADATRRGHLSRLPGLLADTESLGVVGEEATQLLVDRGVLAVMTGRYADASALLDRARGAAARAGTRAMQADVLAQLLLLDMMTGDRQALVGHLAEAQEAAAASFPVIVPQLAWSGAFAGADRAVRARLAGDVDGEGDAVIAVRLIAQEAVDVVRAPTLDRWDRGLYRLVDGELARATGDAAADRWRACVVDLEANTSHWHAVYARYRHAEAVLQESDGPEVVERVLAEAETAARDIGADGLAAWVLDLRLNGPGERTMTEARVIDA